MPLLAFCQLLNALVPVPRLRRVAVALGWALASCITGVPAISPLAIPAARALELKGATYFTKAPWKVDLVSYYTTVWQTRAEYYFTISLDADAGAALGGMAGLATCGIELGLPPCNTGY